MKVPRQEVKKKKMDATYVYSGHTWEHLPNSLSSLFPDPWGQLGLPVAIFSLCNTSLNIPDWMTGSRRLIWTNQILPFWVTETLVSLPWSCAILRTEEQSRPRGEGRVGQAPRVYGDRARQERLLAPLRPGHEPHVLRKSASLQKVPLFA